MGRIHRSRRQNAVLAGALALILPAALAACSSSSSSSSANAAAGTGSGSGVCANIPPGPIKIADIESLSGPNAPGGTLAEISDEIAVNYFNAHDSVCGHKIAFTLYNDKSDPATALSYAREVVQDGVQIMLGDSVGQVQNSIQPYLMEHRILVMTGDGEPEPPSANPTFFDYGPSDAQYALAMVAWAKSHGDNDLGAFSDGTPFAVALTADVEADAKADGLTWIKTITYPPTSLDLTTQLTEAEEAGIKTLLPTGFLDVPTMVSGFKNIGWSPAIIDWGGLNDFGVTESQVPPGTVDGCEVFYPANGNTAGLLSAGNVALLTAMKAKIGLNPATGGILLRYPGMLMIKKAIIDADSLNGAKLTATLDTFQDVPTNIPGLTETFTPTQNDGMNNAGITECTLKQGPYDILYAAS
jgi:ABC-type branched-subunit amino acid transport system substrate-binding protein